MLLLLMGLVLRFMLLLLLLLLLVTLKAKVRLGVMLPEFMLVLSISSRRPRSPRRWVHGEES